MSLSFLIAAPLTVLGDARQPSNAYELVTRDHFPYSPLSTFILIWFAYIVLMLVELYVLFRRTNVFLAAKPNKRAKIHKILALGSKDTSEASKRRDHRVLFWLSSIGILLAFLFHGYIGFVFGATKARALWATPLMPILFIVSAIVSGIAAMILIYILVMKFVNFKVDKLLAKNLLSYLMLFLLLDLFLDIVDILTSGIPEYTQGSTYSAFYNLMLHGPFTFSYFGVQLGLGTVVPIVLWLIPKVRNSVIGSLVISLFVLVGVYAMRWNVVLGGQADSKISSNSVITNSIPLFGYDSIQSVLGVFAVALLLFLLFAWLFPWAQESDFEREPTKKQKAFENVITETEATRKSTLVEEGGI